MSDQAYPDVSSSNALIPPAADGTTSGTVNSPDMSVKTLKPRRRAISNVQHIFQVQYAGERDGSSQKERTHSAQVRSGKAL
jgi:hypothetical protein